MRVGLQFGALDGAELAFEAGQHPVQHGTLAMIEAGLGIALPEVGSPQ